uniref:Helicase ATP-binding domain-containing protein n=1 Tax=viral metagenome TaxID=1070528 RepID=A0A6C0D3C0_9ZZZZ
MKKRVFKKPQSNTKTPTNSTFELTEEYKQTICAGARLGKKGYTILKSSLTKDDLEFLKKDLFVKPVTFGSGIGQEGTAFPVFRENSNKIYLPRFYGIQRYGKPAASEIEEGDDIDVEFTKPLRDYQEEIIDIYMKYVTQNICSQTEQKGSGGILEVQCGGGKTIMALKIVSLIKKKTLIIVHKEFLMNQWIERISEFLPGASVGKIQGQIFDIQGKDIVIGMLQSLYDKEFEADAFSSFGLTIIDEVHRIGSEQFSRALFKTITPYMLGISATVERKDKLTKVLYMFIGEKIYSKEKTDEDLVSVRGIFYISKDTEFNEVELDFRGNTKYSTMISKLCDFGPRSDFIVRVIRDLILEDDEKQIMVLCHNRSLLSYLFDAIVFRGFATVGYYVGGMKQKNLQETEEKQIVLATYAMAAEALDIKTLSTLVMVTPKTDITQSVGRILRAKHANPVIVDIIDSHEPFKKQWLQRKRFYKKNHYSISEIDSTEYKDMLSEGMWKQTFIPKKNGKQELSQSDEEPVDNSMKKCLIDIEGLDLGADD